MAREITEDVGSDDEVDLDEVRFNALMQESLSLIEQNRKGGALPPPLPPRAAHASTSDKSILATNQLDARPAEDTLDSVVVPSGTMRKLRRTFVSVSVVTCTHHLFMMIRYSDGR